jgi:hypothetical membrane protein
MEYGQQLNLRERGCFSMRLRKILGVLSATIAYPFIVASIVLSPWFNFYDNALSDLGNTTLHGSTSWIFNSGLMLSGLVTVSFAILVLTQHRSWKYLSWTLLLLISGVDLALVGLFPENLGSIHWVVSVILFASMALTTLVYSFCSWPLGSPDIGALSLGCGIVIAIIWFVAWPWHGVAIQEILSSAMMSVWLILVLRRNI